MQELMRYAFKAIKPKRRRVSCQLIKDRDTKITALPIRKDPNSPMGQSEQLNQSKNIGMTGASCYLLWIGN